MRAFQFHSQTLVSPLISVWSDLTGNDELKDSGTRYESLLGERVGSRVRANETRKKVSGTDSCNYTDVDPRFDSVNSLKEGVIRYCFFFSWLHSSFIQGIIKLESSESLYTVA